MAEEVEEMVLLQCIEILIVYPCELWVAAVGRRVMLVSGSSISKDWEIIIVALPVLVFQWNPACNLRGALVWHRAGLEKPNTR